MRKLTSFILGSTLFISATHAWAFDSKSIQLAGTVSATATITTSLPTGSGIPSKKPVTLIKYQLTPEQKHIFLSETTASKNLTAEPLILATILPKKVELSMNGVPVLDQGKWGTCVTFATTAALDALVGKGDYISQLCGLQLGRYLEERGFLPSGWNGSLGGWVLGQIESFGIVNKKTQELKSCGGLSKYPLQSTNNGQAVSLDEYKNIHENINKGDWEWISLLTPRQRLEIKNHESTYLPDYVLTQIKKELATTSKEELSHRFTFAVLLPYQHCSAGACAHYHEKDDTWAISESIHDDIYPELAGHEMVIMGYDDEAIAVDDAGKKHTGLFLLRNSWGQEVGDKGNFYMTYDFFKKYVLEIQKIMFDVKSFKA